MTLATPDRTIVDDHAVKRSRLLTILDEHGRDGLLLRSAAAVNWYLDGARTHVSLAADPIVSVRVSRDRDEILVTDNEAERLAAEELPAWAEVITRPWHSPLPQREDLDESRIDAELRAARRVLLPAETEQYRRLCADAATILTDVLHSVSPEQTEQQVAADVAARVVLAGADPLVLLVGGASRSGYRHPLPTTAPIGRYAMVVLCARRHGLIANVTRIIRFGSASLQERRAEHAILDVEADILDALDPGRSLADVLAAAADAYPRRGFDPAEWLRHHQGGAAGYAGRDPRATPDAHDTVEIGQAFAWNPTAFRAKVEDTVLLTDSGIDVLSIDERWPSRDVRGRIRPEVLVR